MDHKLVADCTLNLTAANIRWPPGCFDRKSEQPVELDMKRRVRPVRMPAAVAPVDGLADTKGRHDAVGASRCACTVEDHCKRRPPRQSPVVRNQALREQVQLDSVLVHTETANRKPVVDKRLAVDTRLAENIRLHRWPMVDCNLVDCRASTRRSLLNRKQPVLVFRPHSRRPIASNRSTKRTL